MVRVLKFALICTILLALGVSASAWDIYVAGQLTGTVEKYSQTTAPLGSFATGMSNVQDLDFGKHGDLYALDYNGGAAVVKRFNGTTGALVSTIGSNMKDAMGMTADNDYVYVLHRGAGNDLGTVTRLDPDNPANQMTLVTQGAGYMYEPSGIELGPDGNLYLAARDAETGPAPQAIYAFGRDGSFVGKRVTTAAGRGLAFRDGYIYRDDLWGGFVNRIGLGGLFTGGAETSFPLTGYGDPVWGLGIAFGPDNNLYMGSYFNQRALRFNGATGAFQAELAGLSPANPIDFAFTPIPEPASLAALAAGLIGFSAAFRRRAR